jgi:hypothetical protein
MLRLFALIAFSDGKPVATFPENALAGSRILLFSRFDAPGTQAPTKSCRPSGGWKEI